MIRWAAPFARVDGRRGGDGGPAEVDVTLVREGPSGGPEADSRQRSGAPERRPSPRSCGRSSSRPRRCSWSSGPPSLRRTTLDALATQRFPAYAADLSTYGRALAQRNHLLRAIREEQASRDQLPFWDAKLVEAGAAVLEARHLLLAELAAPLAAAHAEIAPEEGALRLAYVTNAPAGGGETAGGGARPAPARDGREGGLERLDPRRSAPRRHRLRARRPRPLLLRLARPAADGDPCPQARRAGPPDGERRQAPAPPPGRRLLGARSRHAGPTSSAGLPTLPQAFVTTTTLDDLDPALRAAGTAWRVDGGEPPGPGVAGSGARLVEASA